MLADVIRYTISALIVIFIGLMRLTLGLGTRQPGDEVQRLEDDVGATVPTRRLQSVVAVRREPQSLLGRRRAADVAAQTFELLAFMDLGRPRRLDGARASMRPRHVAAENVAR
jgi:hypothetical protein